MAEEEPLDVSRREFALAGTVGLLSLTGTVGTAVAGTQSSEIEFQDATHLVGPADARPEPGGPFFENKRNFAYVYRAIDTKVMSAIRDGDDSWKDLGTSDKWGDSNSDGLLETPNHDGVALSTLGVLLDGDNDIQLEHLGQILDGSDNVELEHLRSILNSNDDIEIEHLGNAWQADGGTRKPSLSLDTWRTPDTNRPVTVRATFNLNPGLDASHVALEVDESGGTSADHSLEESIPAALSAAHTRTISVKVPPGGAYQFRTVSAGDGITVVEHIEEIH